MGIWSLLGASGHVDGPGVPESYPEMVETADRHGFATPSAEPLAPIDAQVAASGAWGFGGRAVLLLANLCATPFLIRLLGPASYGLWTLLLVATTWASTADLGMGTASTKFGAGYYQRGDSRGESSVVWTALGLIAVTTGCVATAVALAAHSVLAGLLHDERGLVNVGTVALRVGCAIFVFQSVAGIVNTPQVVRLRWRQWTVVTTAVNLLGTAGAPVALAVFGGGVTTVAVVNLAASILMVAGNLVLALHLQPALLHPRLDRAVLRKLLTYGGALTVAGVVLVPLSAAERFFLAHNHSTTAVAYFAVALNVATTLQVLPEQLTAPFLPGLARLEAAGRLHDLRALYSKGLSGLFLLVTPAAVLLAFVARPFLSLWAGPQYGAHSTAPLLVAVAGMWFGCLACMPISYLLSSGRTKLIAYIRVAEVVPYLVAAWILTERFGVMGAAFVWSAGCAVDSVLLFGAARRVASLPFLPLSDRYLRSLAGPLVLGSAVLLLAHVTSGLTARVGWAAALTLAYGAAVWYVILTGRERRGIMALAGQALGGNPSTPQGRHATHRHRSSRRSRAPRRAQAPRHARVSPRRSLPPRVRQ
jgi:O-antigen/teichoic acid export membrane protein